VLCHPNPVSSACTKIASSSQMVNSPRLVVIEERIFAQGSSAQFGLLG
jgi:hypothetical protein